MLAVWLVTFTVLGVPGVRRSLCDGAGLEVGLCCEVKTCVSSSILKSVQNIGQENRTLATGANLTVSG